MSHLDSLECTAGVKEEMKTGGAGSPDYMRCFGVVGGRRRSSSPRSPVMNGFNSYRKLATLKNGEKILIRFLNGEDRESLIKLFEEAPLEDIEFCKEDLKNPQVVHNWLNHENSRRILSLVAVEMRTNRPIAALTLFRGEQAALNVGEIQTIFVSRPFQGLGVGSLLIDELLDLAVQKNLHWLRVEMPLEQKYAIKAFISREFEIRATFEDFFISKEGVPHDVAIMMRPLIKKRR